jgi:hypothetical protein
MALLGSSVDPRLFVQDYSGFTRAADIQGQSMANIGADIGGIAKQFGEYKKQQSEQEKRVKSAELVANAIAKSFPTLAPVAMEAQMIMGDKNNSLQDRVAAADAVEKALNIGISNAYKEREFGLQKRQLDIEEGQGIQAALMKQAELKDSKWQPYDKEIEIDGKKVKVIGSVDQFGQFKDIKNNIYPSVAGAFSPAGQSEPPLPDGEYPDGTPTVGIPMDGPGVLQPKGAIGGPTPPSNFDYSQFPSIPGETPVTTIAPEVVANIEAAGGQPATQTPRQIRLPAGSSVVTDEQKGEIVTQEEASRRTASGLSVTTTPVGKGMVRITSQTGSPKPSPVIESPESKLQTQRLLKFDESLGLLREAGTTASLDIQPLKEITNLLDANVKTGFGQETLMQAKKILGQDVSSEEEFQARVGAEAMKNIALTKGAISDREMDYFKTVLSPNMGKTTEGNKKIIEFRIKYADRANKISGTISDLQEQGKSPFEIKKAVDKIISSEPLLDNAGPKKTEVNQADEDAKFLGGFQ